MTRNRELLLKCKRPMRKHFSARRSTGAAAGIALIAAAALAAILLCIGCGNNFRPVVNPILQAGGDPCGTPGFVHVIAQNPSGAAGSASQIDICDFDASDMSIGRAPLRGALVNGKVFIANSTDNSLSNYTPGAPRVHGRASLTGGTDPVFVGGTETGSSAFAYAALAGSSAVAVVNTNPPSLKTTVPLGHTPVALAELFPPNASKVYVADSDGKVSVIQTAALNQTPATISVGGNPVWITANPNNSAVYVLDPTNTRVDIIDPGRPPARFRTAFPWARIRPSRLRFMYFDSHLQRLYVTNTGDNPGPSARSMSGGTTLIPLAAARLRVDEQNSLTEHHFDKACVANHSAYIELRWLRLHRQFGIKQRHRARPLSERNQDDRRWHYPGLHCRIFRRHQGLHGQQRFVKHQHHRHSQQHRDHDDSRALGQRAGLGGRLLSFS